MVLCERKNELGSAGGFFFGRARGMNSILKMGGLSRSKGGELNKKNVEKMCLV